ncbi:MAG: Hsp20 family protein [Candidatus Acidiferrum sp.]
MQEQNLVRHKTAESPVVIKTTGLSVEAKAMFDSIARRAFEIFESKGRVRGQDLDNWLQAEAELFKRTPLKVTQSPDGVTVLADVRGFAPKELEVDLEPQRVTIIGKRPRKTERKTVTNVSSQKRTTRLLRSLHLQVEIDTRQATARLKRGILELDLKKALAAREKPVQTSSSGNGA